LSPISYEPEQWNNKKYFQYNEFEFVAIETAEVKAKNAKVLKNWEVIGYDTDIIKTAGDTRST